jgi:hypothetical protein
VGLNGMHGVDKGFTVWLSNASIGREVPANHIRCRTYTGLQVMILTLKADEIAENETTMFGSIDLFDAAGLAISPSLRGDEDEDFDEDFGEDEVDDDDDEDFEDEVEDEFEDDDDFEDDDFDDDDDDDFDDDDDEEEDMDDDDL